MTNEDLARSCQPKSDFRKLGADGFLRETFTLPVDEARAKARSILNEYPTGGYMTVVDWRQLPDGRLEFTMRRLPTAD